MQPKPPFGFARLCRTGSALNVFNYLVLFLTLLFPLLADDRVSPDSTSEWNVAVREAQDQLGKGKFAEAVESGQHSLQIARRAGAADSKVANSYYLLGLIYHDWAHCAESRANYILAIATLRRQSDPDVQFIFNAEMTLISGLCECDDFDAANKAFRTYEPDLVKYARDSIGQARLLSLKAALFCGNRKYAKAENLFLQAIALMEKTPGASPLELAVDRSTLSTVFSKEGRYAEGLAQLGPAIAFFEGSAPRNPSLVASLNNAACILEKMGRNEESERYFRRALTIAQDLYGEDNRVSAIIMGSYARLLRANKQPQTAAEWQKRSAEAARRSAPARVETINAEELRAIRR
jgi:tetratricopeptide (TPR) repeat protein